MGKRRPAGERFWEKVDRTAGDDGCWLWLGTTTGVGPPAGRGGYGRFWPDGKPVLAHRYAYELLAGPIPAGLTIDHLCRNRICVNPRHLEPVTGRENSLRGTGVGARNAAKTHCPNGHELVAIGENRRGCPICDPVRARETKRRSAARRRDDYADRRRALERERYRQKMADPVLRAKIAAKARAAHARRKENRGGG